MWKGSVGTSASQVMPKGAVRKQMYPTIREEETMKTTKSMRNQHDKIWYNTHAHEQVIIEHHVRASDSELHGARDRAKMLA